MPWVFGYGALIWAPGFAHVERVEATLYGYHRAFNRSDTADWGSPEQPAPVIGLAAGGRCEGVAFRVAQDAFEGVMSYLERRVDPAFDLHWCDVVTGDGRDLQALVAVNHARGSELGELSVEQRARMAVAAKGDDGSGADHVQGLRERLRDHGIVDPYVEDMAAQVASLDAADI